MARGGGRRGKRGAADPSETQEAPEEDDTEQEAPPLPQKRKMLSKSDTVCCGSCGVKRSDPSAQWPEVPNETGEVERVGFACIPCWDPYERVFKHETSWTKHCAKLKGDSKYKKRVDDTKDISKNPEKAAFDQEEVNAVVEQGYTTIGNYICMKPELLEKQAGGNVTVGMADISTQKVLAPLTKQKLTAVCAAHPDKPPVEVQTFTTVKCQKVACTLPRRAALTDTQSQVEMKKALAEVTKMLPVPCRGHVKPPDIDSLVKQLQGAKLARAAGGAARPDGGEQVSEAAAGAADAAGGGASGAADAEAAAAPDEGDDDESSGKASNSDGEASGAAPAAGPAASVAAMTVVGRAAGGRRGGGQHGLSPAASAEKLRLDELVHDYPLAAILEGTKMGDRTYALRRFNPKQRGVEINRAKHLAKVDAAIALHKNLATMTPKDRATQFDIIGDSDVLDASTFLDRLICKVVSEAEAGDDVVKALLPWAPADADQGAAFQLKRPRVHLLRMSNNDKANACRDTFLNSFLAEVVAKGEASVEIVRSCAREFVSECSVVLGDKEKFPDWVNIAAVLQVCAEALLVISDSSPKAADMVTDRAAVRKMLNGTYSKEWTLCRDSLMSDPHWARLTTEYLEHALSDLQVGPEILAAVAKVKSNQLDSAVTASRKLKGWIDRSRTGGVLELEKAFAEWVVQATSAAGEHSLGYDAIGQIREVISNLIAASTAKKASGILDTARLTASEEAMELTQTKLGSERKRDAVLNRMKECTKEDGPQ
ncbi:unnamed protein product [Prorocentrum cordatum]|uniref:Uncharacterized protein n=1 Tax=Prorocentrum cordatum TaxID=2364126 RepID=A0ABN9XIA1_9DINO|nr:unnamed protein product [Polarella glacialis]